MEKVDNRGVQLASLFMSGVDTALFVNDVCGQPLPWDHCCPWGFFDGKLFQSKLAKATRDRASLLDMCEGQVRHLYVQVQLFNISQYFRVFLMSLTFCHYRRNWFQGWRRCARPFWKASTCPGRRLHLHHCHPLHSSPLPWCPLFTPCILFILLAQWAPCRRLLTITTSTGPGPSQV